MTLLMVISASVIQANDKTVDGIKFRYSTVLSQDKFEIDDYEIAEYDTNINMTYTGPFAGKQKFPIAIVFPESLMATWLFRQAYFDFSIEDEINDIPPIPDQSISSQLDSAFNDSRTTIHLRQKTGTREYLRENFLPKYFSASQISNLPENWAITHDLKRSALALGYMWGFFIPLGEKHRFFKIGMGLGIALLDNNIKIKFCDSYDVAVKTQKDIQDKDNLANSHEGKCTNPNNLENIAYKEIIASYGGHFTVWERISKDSAWQILSIDNVQIMSFYKDEKVKTLDGRYARFTTGLSGSDIITYTYRF
tara:strand:- start:69 stop:992 length:924 start_codon:yes stop_codon:yes gene_type:complete